MPDTPISPTPYVDVNTILQKILKNAHTILGDHFIGLYVHGSLAGGDFNPQTSDIDFLVVADADLPAEAFSALKEMHACLRASGLPWSQKMEGAYLPRLTLRRHDPTQAPVPWLGVDGHFALETLGRDWTIQRWILREKGIVVTGPPLKPMIDPVSPNDLRQAVLGSLSEWWSPPFPSPERFQSGEYRAYAVLTMCRSLYVLEHGMIASKPAAARWAQSALGEPWVGLIEDAAGWREGMKFDRPEEIFGFIAFTLDHFR